MTTAKKTAPRTKTAAGEYLARVKIGGRTYTANGDTVSSALVKLKPQGVAKSVSIVSITKGTMTKERILTAPQTFRLFNGGRFMREVALNNVSLLFDL